MSFRDFLKGLLGRRAKTPSGASSTSPTLQQATATNKATIRRLVLEFLRGIEGMKTSWQLGQVGSSIEGVVSEEEMQEMETSWQLGQVRTQQEVAQDSLKRTKSLLAKLRQAGTSQEVIACIEEVQRDLLLAGQGQSGVPEDILACVEDVQYDPTTGKMVWGTGLKWHQLLEGLKRTVSAHFQDARLKASPTAPGRVAVKDIETILTRHDIAGTGRDVRAIRERAAEEGGYTAMYLASLISCLIVAGTGAAKRPAMAAFAPSYKRAAAELADLWLANFRETNPEMVDGAETAKRIALE